MRFEGMDGWGRLVALIAAFFLVAFLGLMVVNPKVRCQASLGTWHAEYYSIGGLFTGGDVVPARCEY